MRACVCVCGRRIGGVYVCVCVRERITAVRRPLKGFFLTVFPWAPVSTNHAVVLA